MIYDSEFINNLNDDELIHLVRNCDETAFAELMSRYTPKIWGRVIDNSRYIQDAEEILSNIWISVWDNIQSLKKIDSFGAWLQSITFNACNRYYASTKHKKIEIPLTDVELTEIIDRGADTRLRKNELFSDMSEVIYNLPMRVKSVAELYYIELWKMHEISHELKIPLGTVKSRLREARKLLQKEYDMEEEQCGIINADFVKTHDINDNGTHIKLIIASLNGDTEATELLTEIVKKMINDCIQNCYNPLLYLCTEEELKMIELETLEKVMNWLDFFLFTSPFYMCVHTITGRTYSKYYMELKRKRLAERKEKTNK